MLSPFGPPTARDLWRREQAVHSSLCSNTVRPALPRSILRSSFAFSPPRHNYLYDLSYFPQTHLRVSPFFLFSFFYTTLPTPSPRFLFAFLLGFRVPLIPPRSLPFCRDRSSLACTAAAASEAIKQWEFSTQQMCRIDGRRSKRGWRWAPHRPAMASGEDFPHLPAQSSAVYLEDCHTAQKCVCSLIINFF